MGKLRPCPGVNTSQDLCKLGHIATCLIILNQGWHSTTTFILMTSTLTSYMTQSLKNSDSYQRPLAFLAQPRADQQ